MGVEIERKFLVDRSAIPLPERGERIIQGYIPTATKTAVRVRIKGTAAFLTLKGANRGAVRAEFEYPIPLEDAEAMLAQLCEGPKIDKIRYQIEVGSHQWELDLFQGDNEGLIVAEVELAGEEEPFQRPAWVTEEVTGDPRYYNANLIHQPYCAW